MKSLLAAVALLLLLVSCKKEKEEAIADLTKLEYGTFITKTGNSFTGTFNQLPFSWNFGMDFQGIMGYVNGNGICDSTDPVRMLLFGLTSNDVGHTTRFQIYTPKYDASSLQESANVFSIGKKQLGDYRTNFSLTIQQDNKTYQSRGSDPANVIEVLKTEEVIDFMGKKIRVWFRIDAKLSSCNCQNTNAVLSKGLMIAEFFGHRKGF